MSSSNDVLEMQTICGEIADRLADSAREKDRIGAVLRAFNYRIGWNRVLEFLRGRARRVDSWEKDHARAALADIKRAERQRRDHEHLAWLREQIDRAKASGEEFHGAHIDGLEHFLRLGSDPAGPVEVRDADGDTAADAPA